MPDEPNAVPAAPPDGATVELDGRTWVCSYEAGRARWLLRIGYGATVGCFSPVYDLLDSVLSALWREREARNLAEKAP